MTERQVEQKQMYDEASKMFNDELKIRQKQIEEEKW